MVKATQWINCSGRGAQYNLSALDFWVRHLKRDDAKRSHLTLSYQTTQTHFHVGSQKDFYRDTGSFDWIQFNLIELQFLIALTLHLRNCRLSNCRSCSYFQLIYVMLSLSIASQPLFRLIVFWRKITGAQKGNKSLAPARAGAIQEKEPLREILADLLLISCNQLCRSEDLCLFENLINCGRT